MSDETISRLVHECRRLDDEQVADLITRLAAHVRDRHLERAGAVAAEVGISVLSKFTPDETRGHSSIRVRVTDADRSERVYEARKDARPPAPALAAAVMQRDEAAP